MGKRRPRWPVLRSHKARHILDERFERGEIDKDDYEERKRVLSD